MFARHERDGQAGGRRWPRLLAGPLLTLLFAAACEGLAPTRFAVPAPGVVLTLFVVWSSLVGGRGPGFASAGLAAAYLAWLNGGAQWPPQWSGAGLERARVLWVTLPLLAWMTGGLHARALREAARARVAAGEREARLQQAHTLATLNATLESTADGILVVDARGQWILRNQRFATVLGLPRELAESGDRERVREHLAARSVDPAAFRGRVEAILANAEAESFDEVEFRDGRVLERASIPMRVGGLAVGRVWSLRDVTESRRQALALRESERRAMQSQKLEAIGRLAGGVAHDFNNVLAVVLGESGLLSADLREGSPGRGSLERIRAATERGARLTRQLLAFGRRHGQPAHEVDLREMLLAMEAGLRQLAGEPRAFALELPGAAAAPVVHAEEAMLQSAVQNLVSNAVDATPAGGRVTVRLFRESLSAEQAARRGAPGAREYACLEVADDGAGIPDDVRPHLFEPFFTTKPPGEGTGLGLAAVHGTVHEAGGFVEVESRPGEGARFRLMLPALAGARSAPDGLPARAARLAAAAPGNGDGALVLLADDEAMVRRIVVRMLSAEGFRVVEAANGAEALAAFEALAEPSALLLTDLRMPGISGLELARRLRSRRPQLPVVIMSGWPAQTLDEMEPGEEKIPVLPKPFRREDLVATVREALGGIEPPIH